MEVSHASESSFCSAEVTNTVSLPDNLAAVVAQNDFSASSSKHATNPTSALRHGGDIDTNNDGGVEEGEEGEEEEQTEAIEMDLHSLMRHIDQSHSFVRASMSNRVSLIDSSPSASESGGSNAHDEGQSFSQMLNLSTGEQSTQSVNSHGTGSSVGGNGNGALPDGARERRMSLLEEAHHAASMLSNDSGISSGSGSKGALGALIGRDSNSNGDVNASVAEAETSQVSCSAASRSSRSTCSTRSGKSAKSADTSSASAAAIHRRRSPRLSASRVEDTTTASAAGDSGRSSGQHHQQEHSGVNTSEDVTHQLESSLAALVSTFVESPSAALASNSGEPICYER